MKYNHCQIYDYNANLKLLMKFLRIAIYMLYEFSLVIKDITYAAVVTTNQINQISSTLYIFSPDLQYYKFHTVSTKFCKISCLYLVQWLSPICKECFFSFSFQ